MTKNLLFTQEGFDKLLDWLDDGSGNREDAGRQYEKIRQRLIQIFQGRGCFTESEELADLTINRVIIKLPEIRSSYLGNPFIYFYSIADKIFHEWQRKQKNIKRLTEFFRERQADEDKPSREYQCLVACLASLPADRYEMIVEYYSYKKNKAVKIEHRRELAKKLGMELKTLHMKTCRLRVQLQKCVKKCVFEKK